METKLSKILAVDDLKTFSIFVFSQVFLSTGTIKNNSILGVISFLAELVQS